MSIGKPASRAAFAAALIAIAAAPAAAQQHSGDGFLFRPPPGAITLRGGAAMASASGGVFTLVRDRLTLDPSDFTAGSWGVDLAITMRPRVDFIFSFDRATSLAKSEYRDYVDNNDMPIEQYTRLHRTPVMGAIRYYLADRGRQLGNAAWIPASGVTTFVEAGVGSMRYRFDQFGDFVDDSSLVVFPAVLASRGWTPAFRAGAGAEWAMGPRFVLTGQARYLHAKGDGDSPNGDFAGYDINLSGVSTFVGLTIRF